MTPGGRGAVPVDEHCRAPDGLWAVGDVTGVALFIHVGMYQGRVVASNILGRDRAASCHGIPRLVVTDPPRPATAASASPPGSPLADSIDRPWTYERDPRGPPGVLADRNRRVLAGARAVAPLASEWIHQAALAIRAQIPHRHPARPGRPAPHLRRGLSRRAGTARPVHRAHPSATESAVRHRVVA